MFNIWERRVMLLLAGVNLVAAILDFRATMLFAFLISGIDC